MKVGTFQRVGEQKQGGNVASYFCTPQGQVMHIVAGPVDADVLLREARWVIETRKLARLGSDDERRLRETFRQAHLERFQEEYPGHPVPALPVITSGDIANLLHSSGHSVQGRIHLLLTTAPLVSIEKAYRAIFEELLNEPVTTIPVRDRASADNPVPGGTKREDAQAARCSATLAEIHSGQALNAMLLQLQALASRGVSVPALPIPEEILHHLQPAAGGLEHGPAWLARKTLPWPPLLRMHQLDQSRHYLENRIGRLTQPGPGQWVDVDEIASLVAYIEDIESWIAMRLRASPSITAWDWRASLEAWRFLKELRCSLHVLAHVDGARYLDGSISLQGKTIAELVQHMAANGLRFGPALPDDEAAYLALHRLLVQAFFQARMSVD